MILETDSGAGHKLSHKDDFGTLQMGRIGSFEFVDIDGLVGKDCDEC